MRIKVTWFREAASLGGKTENGLCIRFGSYFKYAIFTRFAVSSIIYFYRKRDFIVPVLQDVGLKCDAPDGAYYVMAEIADFGFKDDLEFTKYLIREIGVACVPGSSFYKDTNLGKNFVRFCFCKKDETLAAAAERLQKLKKG